MPRNGSGTYSPPSNSWNPATNGVPATAADWQSILNDIAATLTQSLSKDGQTPVVGNLPMSGNKLTGLGVGTASGDSLAWQQLFSQGIQQNINSSTVTDIGLINSAFITIAGPVTIDSFGNNYNGPRFLVFSGTLTINHSANLILPNSSAIAAKDGDTAIVVPNGNPATGWRMVYYSGRLKTSDIVYDGETVTTSDNKNFQLIFGSNGVALVGSAAKNPSHPNAHIVKSSATTDGTGVLIVDNANGTNGTSVFIGVGAAGVGYNASNTVLGVYRSSVSSRSINAAGTINASGADYAEYMRKAYMFELKKGGIAGVDSNGQLTLKYKDSVTFLVKSTDPCMVGGDVWGTEETLGLKKPLPPELLNPKEGEELTKEQQVLNQKLEKQYQAELDAFTKIYEDARTWYDRMSFCGRCPVNVFNAKPGDYIVPDEINGDISFKVVKAGKETFDDYKKAVGKVINILDDGRAEVIVKAI